MARPAHDAMMKALARDFAAEERDEEELLRQTQVSLADLVCATPEEIAITQSASDSFNRIINALDWRKGDNVVLTDVSYRTMAMVLLRLRDHYGVSLRVAATREWQVDPEAISRLVDEQTRLVVIDHVPMFCGVVQPVAGIAEALCGSRAMLLLNATQSVGQLPINVRATRCALAIGTSRKWLRGPRGLGFLFVRRDLIESLRPPVVGYPATEWVASERFEYSNTIDRLHIGDQPYQMMVGLTASVRYAMNVGIEKIAARNAQLGRSCRRALQSVKGVTVYDAERGTTGTVPFNIGGVLADKAVTALEGLGVRACTVYAENARGAFARMACDSLIRASLHYFNSESDIARLIEAVERVRDAKE